jgi:hypothetical protein
MHLNPFSGPFLLVDRPWESSGSRPARETAKCKMLTFLVEHESQDFSVERLVGRFVFIACVWSDRPPRKRVRRDRCRCRTHSSLGSARAFPVARPCLPCRQGSRAAIFPAFRAYPRSRGYPFLPGASGEYLFPSCVLAGAASIHARVKATTWRQGVVSFSISKVLSAGRAHRSRFLAHVHGAVSRPPISLGHVAVRRDACQGPYTVHECLLCIYRHQNDNESSSGSVQGLLFLRFHLEIRSCCRIGPSLDI